MDELTESLIKALDAQKERVIFAYLFGSAAEGKTAPTSDIDVALYLSKKHAASPLDERLHLYGELSRALMRNDIDVVILNTTRNLMLLDEVIRHGVVVLDQDPDLREDFELTIMHRAIDFKTQRAVVVGF